MVDTGLGFVDLRYPDCSEEQDGEPAQTGNQSVERETA